MAQRFDSFSNLCQMLSRKKDIAMLEAGRVPEFRICKGLRSGKSGRKGTAMAGPVLEGEGTVASRDLREWTVDKKYVTHVPGKICLAVESSTRNIPVQGHLK